MDMNDLVLYVLRLIGNEFYLILFEIDILNEKDV
jgi:hypothetical protein